MAQAWLRSLRIGYGIVRLLRTAAGMVLSRPFSRDEAWTAHGEIRLGSDELLVDATGHSNISVQDYAVAMIDQLERPEHVRQRFTVGY